MTAVAPRTVHEVSYVMKIQHVSVVVGSSTGVVLCSTGVVLCSTGVVLCSTE